VAKVSQEAAKSARVATHGVDISMGKNLLTVCSFPVNAVDSRSVQEFLRIEVIGPTARDLGVN